MKSLFIIFVNILQPLQDQQRQLNERMAKMQHTLDVMSYQQKERDTNSNINRDMVMLVVLVVMIQVRCYTSIVLIIK